ncbi:hypothetical protein [Reichenbachiella ulvae]|uniref:HIRAN domain-containing protein n=1 Tax=Reichenbachiella ulvae TaxID=2980104 RepID=A0ABT3CZU4_9BACT|nr:hypothetical protein [Reichenbachiella ulvae]MCV9389147.1 hypothetical protein [Reichenbachiella ulvae]
MRDIGNIFLVWRKGVGDRRIVVGELKTNSTTGTRFRYITDNVAIAEKHGFTPYTGFPYIEKEYNTNVLEVFSQRLMKSERNDLADFYDFWKVDSSRRFDPYYMLAQTQGLLPIDNFEFLAEFYPIKGLLFISEISGLSHLKLKSDELSIGDVLNYELDPKNPKDEMAVKLMKGQKEVGYVKVIHSRVFHRSKARVKVTIHHLEKNGNIKRAFLKIEI